MVVSIEEKFKGIIASRGIIHIPARIKKKLGLTDHKAILLSIEGNKLIIELEPENEVMQKLETKKKNLLNFIESSDLVAKEDISVEEFLNESRRY